MWKTLWKRSSRGQFDALHSGCFSGLHHGRASPQPHRSPRPKPRDYTVASALKESRTMRLSAIILPALFTCALTASLVAHDPNQHEHGGAQHPAGGAHHHPEVLVEAIGAAVDSPCRGAN